MTHSKRHNPGKREREARKRHRRGLTMFFDHQTSEWVRLKLGRKKGLKLLLRDFFIEPSRGLTASLLSVADAEMPDGIPEEYPS